MEQLYLAAKSDRSNQPPYRGLAVWGTNFIGWDGTTRARSSLAVGLALTAKGVMA